ncbi:MAG: spore germination protein, partial [Bacilli bacterium]|nr:spore germination protein [Bacilli bacterium]
MAKDRKEQKKKIIDKKVSQINNSLNKGTLFNNLKDNLSYMKELFVDDDLFIIREIENNFNPSFRCAIAYCEGLINPNIINESIIKPLMISKNIKKDDTLIDHLAKRIIQLYNIKKTKIIKDIVESVTYGDVILFIDGIAEVLILNVKKFEARSLTEPENEKILIGPREGFIEFLPTNLSLIRRRLRTNKLKFKYLSFGDKTNTQACICYIDGIVDNKILTELYKRLKKIKIDGVIDTNYITELIKDNRFSPYRTTGYTEKPDVVVGKLLEGRIAIVLDGSPIVLTIPYFFVENFQTSEDYYMNFYYTSFVRILRILGYFFSITVPAF